ncbi:hypothetical protein MKW94_017316 [Papaver nudicaule]|uniref:GH18 domain-containing protein n=1 Tax=Papaver nudicaule TaxID=74823 RepID=A0AA41V767_PAPNU|nr:hypothetical protein [Papaver nudicaule]
MSSSSSSSSMSSSSSSNGIIGGIWPSSSANKIPPSIIPKSHYTHVFYAYVQADPSANFKLKITRPTDPDSKWMADHEKWMPKLMHHLRSEDPSVKVFLAIGGANEEGKEALSAMAPEKTYRKSFIQSTIEVAREYGFDGVNLGWEFPNGELGMKNLVSILSELREAVEQEALDTGKAKLGISASVYFTPDLRLKSSKRYVPYLAKEIANNVDFINVMCYDYAGYWNTSRTGAIAALYNINGKNSTSSGILEWIKVGVPAEKLVMGLPMYGRTWKLRDPDNNGIGAPAVGVGTQSGKTSEGFQWYSDVVKSNRKHDATEKYDEETVSYYSYAGTNWISYDGPRSIEAKVKFAKENRLGGYYFYAIGQDHEDELWKAG